MITLFAAGGASDFTIDGNVPPRNASSLLEHAARLLRARGKTLAVEILTSVPFKLQAAFNDFMDEFDVLIAEVPLEVYERVRRKAEQPGTGSAYREIAAVFNELGTYVRFIAVEMSMPPVEKEHTPGGLTEVEINKLVYKYIGVEGGYLGDFSYRTHHEFYIELDLNIDPNRYAGTTRERFIAILRGSTPVVQARILRGILERFPADDKLRTPQRRREVETWIARLSGLPAVASPSLRVTSEVVQRALTDAERLLETTGATSSVDRVHTALHGYCIAVCREAGIVTTQEPALTELIKLLSQHHPAFQEHAPRKEDTLKILRALASIMDALNPLRNKASVAHPNEELLSEPEAMLAINSVRSILHYLDQKLGAWQSLSK